MEFHEYLAEVIRQDPSLVEKIYSHSGLEVPRSLIKWWAEGLVVPADSIQDRVAKFVESVKTVTMIKDVSLSPTDLPRR